MFAWRRCFAVLRRPQEFIFWFPCVSLESQRQEFMPWNTSASTSENEWESKGTHITYMEYEEFKTALTDISAITAYTPVMYPIMWPKSKHFTGSDAERDFWAEKRSKFPALNRIHDRDEFRRPIRCSARNMWSGNHPSEQKAVLTCRLVLTWFCELMSALAAINFPTTSTWPLADAVWRGDHPS